MPTFVTRPLQTLAWLNVALHLLGLMLALYGMRPGTSAVPLDARLAYLAAAPWGWTWGWATWMLCTGVLLAYGAVLTSQLGASAWARLGLTLAAVGGGIDWLCDAVNIGLLPRLAAASAPPHPLFLTFAHFSLNLGGMVVANGMYSFAVLLWTVALHCAARSSRWTLASGYFTFAAGMCLSAAGFTAVPWHAEVATGMTIGGFCAWSVLAAKPDETRGVK